MRSNNQLTIIIVQVRVEQGFHFHTSSQIQMLQIGEVHLSIIVLSMTNMTAILLQIAEQLDPIQEKRDVHPDLTVETINDTKKAGTIIAGISTHIIQAGEIEDLVEVQAHLEAAVVAMIKTGNPAESITTMTGEKGVQEVTIKTISSSIPEMKDQNQGKIYLNH